MIRADSALRRHFGAIDFSSGIIPFKYTDYYEGEFGKGLSRAFVCFSKLIAPEKLSAIKLFTNALEQKFSRDSRRLINIDPGYVDMAKLVLATTKDYAHRIYLGRGIFAEITLRFKEKSFVPPEWTYPDYKTADYIGIFNRIRGLYAAQINEAL